MNEPVVVNTQYGPTAYVPDPLRAAYNFISFAIAQKQSVTIKNNLCGTYTVTAQCGILTFVTK
jgi:hypothetical protein